MVTSKRKEVTADDLLRRQEGPQKRPKLPRTAQGDEDEDESAVEDLSGVSDEEQDEEDEDGGKESEESEDADAGMDVPSTGPRRSEAESSLLGSRVSIKPRLVLQRPLSPEARPSENVTFSSLEISPPLQAARLFWQVYHSTLVHTVLADGSHLEGRDCIGNAKTGSGKTIAFALPILQRLSKDPYGIFALVLTPTRELAFQISEQFAVLGGPLNTRTAVIVGGMDMIAQAVELNNRPHVVVATPGRIVDHLRSSSAEWDLSRVKFLVLDEADRLLTSSFADDLAHLFGILPKDRQTALFTATWTPSIDSIADAAPRPGKQKAFIHKITTAIETVETLKQYYVLVPSHVRESYLYHLLCNPPEAIVHLRRSAPAPATGSHASGRKKGSAKKADADKDFLQPPPTIIFCAKTRTAAYLTALLQTLSVRSTALHSRLTQRDRLSSLSLFRSSVIPVLVSTDVGARGLDIPDVALVINWDLPNEPEEYTHRVGRTARAGRAGLAVSFVSEHDETRVLEIEERISTRLAEMELPEDKVLEKLNKVSTAKRQAYMVSGPRPTTLGSDRRLCLRTGTARYEVWRERADQQDQGNQKACY
ncbi:P-loop containing nucleoside triphosphate hydrolase protein [Gloeopeniophorella convolvens]|nr:P-loop containing nucleoside triphosphate hydrolase protein [Gloeopeniophorella convolvens]